VLGVRELVGILLSEGLIESSAADAIMRYIGG